MLDLEAVMEACSKPRVVLSTSGDVLHVDLGQRKSYLGKLEKKILAELLNGPLQGADVARALRTWNSNVYKALRRLEEKGLVNSTGFAGSTVPGTPVMRRFYTLNAAVTQLAVEIPETSQEELKQAAEDAQARGLLHQEASNARMQLGSPNLMKSSHGRRELLKLRRQIDETLHRSHDHH